MVGMMSPLHLLLKTQSPWSHFKDMYVWGCPCYVLDPMLQDRHKLPKWKPCSHCGFFVGSTPCHSLLTTCVEHPNWKDLSSIHVVFDDWFTSVTLVGGDDAFNPTQWQQLFTNSQFNTCLILMSLLPCWMIGCNSIWKLLISSMNNEISICCSNPQSCAPEGDNTKFTTICSL